MRTIDVLFMLVVIITSPIIHTAVHELTHVVMVTLFEPNARIVSIHLFDRYCISNGTLGMVIVEGKTILSVETHEFIAYFTSTFILTIYLAFFIKKYVEMKNEIHKQGILKEHSNK